MKKFLIVLGLILASTTAGATSIPVQSSWTGSTALVTGLSIPTDTGGATPAASQDYLLGNTTTGSNPQDHLRYYDVTNGNSSYLPQSVYGLNLDPAKLQHFRKCLAKVNTKTGRCLVVRMGDSTTIGINAAGSSNWPNEGDYLAKYLTSAKIPTFQNAFSGDSTGTSTGVRTSADARIALGNWSGISGNTTLGGFLFFTSSSGTAFSFTPTTAIDTCKVWFNAFGVGGSGTLQVGSGSTALVDGTLSGIETQTATSSLAAQGCKVNWTGGNGQNQIYLGSMLAYDSTQPGVDLMDAGWWGTKASDWSSTSSAFSSQNWLVAVAPDVLILKVGINDISGGTSLSTYKTELTSIINSVSATTDVIIETDNPYNATAATQQPYINAAYEVAQASNIPLIDTYSIWGTYTNANTALGFMSDTLHPNTSGYSDQAAREAAFLASVMPEGALNSKPSDHLSFQPGLMTAVSNAKAAFHKVSQNSTVDNLEVSAQQFSCTGNPTITMYECGTSTTCASSPVTIGTATITAAGTVVDGAISSAAITAGDYVAFAVSAGTCITLDIAATAQIHTN